MKGKLQELPLCQAQETRNEISPSLWLFQRAFQPFLQDFYSSNHMSIWFSFGFPYSYVSPHDEFRCFNDEFRSFNDELRCFNDELRGFNYVFRCFNDEFKCFNDKFRYFNGTEENHSRTN